MKQVMLSVDEVISQLECDYEVLPQMAEGDAMDEPEIGSSEQSAQGLGMQDGDTITCQSICDQLPPPPSKEPQKNAGLVFARKRNLCRRLVVEVHSEDQAAAMVNDTAEAIVVSTQELHKKLAGPADESDLEEGEIRDTDEIGDTHELDERVAQDGQRAAVRRMGVNKRDLALDDDFRQELEEKEVLDEMAFAQSAGGTDLRSPALWYRRRLCPAWVLGSCQDAKCQDAHGYRAEMCPHLWAVTSGCSGLVRMRNARMPTDIEQKCARTCGLSRLWIYQTLCVLVCVLEEASTVVLLTPPMSCRKCWILVSCTETLIKSESCRNCAQQSWGKIDAAGAAPVPSRTRLENCSQSSMERQYFGQWNVKSTCNRTDALVFRAEASFATIG